MNVNIIILRYKYNGKLKQIYLSNCFYGKMYFGLILLFPYNSLNATRVYAQIAIMKQCLMGEEPPWWLSVWNVHSACERLCSNSHRATKANSKNSVSNNPTVKRSTPEIFISTLYNIPMYLLSGQK